MTKTPPVAEPFPAAAAPLVSPDPFVAPGGPWHPLPPSLAGVRRTSTVLTAVPLIVGCAVMAWLLPGWWKAVPGAVAVLLVAWAVWRWLRAPAWVAAWGWSERGDDFCVRSGLWTRRLTIVPYGRLQTVTVSAGPLLRRAGLARLALVTAAVETDAALPGLDADTAAALRDRMVARTDAHGSGL